MTLNEWACSSVRLGDERKEVCTCWQQLAYLREGTAAGSYAQVARSHGHSCENKCAARAQVDASCGIAALLDLHCIVQDIMTARQQKCATHHKHDYFNGNIINMYALTRAAADFAHETEL